VKVTSYWLRERRVCSGSIVPGVFPARVWKVLCPWAVGTPRGFSKRMLALLPITFSLGTNRNMIQSKRRLHSKKLHHQLPG
jgi:hypothetical protein